MFPMAKIQLFPNVRCFLWKITLFPCYSSIPKSTWKNHNSANRRFSAANLYKSICGGRAYRHVGASSPTARQAKWCCAPAVPVLPWWVCLCAVLRSCRLPLVGASLGGKQTKRRNRFECLYRNRGSAKPLYHISTNNSRLNAWTFRNLFSIHEICRFRLRRIRAKAQLIMSSSYFSIVYVCFVMAKIGIFWISYYFWPLFCTTTKRKCLFWHFLSSLLRIEDYCLEHLKISSYPDCKAWALSFSSKSEQFVAP